PPPDRRRRDRRRRRRRRSRPPLADPSRRGASPSPASRQRGSPAHAAPSRSRSSCPGCLPPSIALSAHATFPIAVSDEPRAPIWVARDQRLLFWPPLEIAKFSYTTRCHFGRTYGQRDLRIRLATQELHYWRNEPPKLRPLAAMSRLNPSATRSSPSEAR